MADRLTITGAIARLQALLAEVGDLPLGCPSEPEDTEDGKDWVPVLSLHTADWARPAGTPAEVVIVDVTG
jgi:hypothetical protein